MDTTFTYWQGVANFAELMAYMDTHNGDLPDCEMFAELSEGDEELIAGTGFIEEIPTDMDDEELSQIPRTLREALGDFYCSILEAVPREGVM